jgi:hypothetical protein
MEQRTLAILGGTGQMGGALARRFAAAGQRVIIGSRDAGRAADAARAIGAAVTGCGMAEAAAAAEIAILAVPWPAHRATLENLRHAFQGKILIDVTVPLSPPRVARVELPPEGSAAVAAQALLGPEVKVVSAFQTVPAVRLAASETAIDGDVLVCSNDRPARGVVVDLARAIGLNALHGGALANSAAAEALAAVVIFLDGYYRGATSIRFDGIARR